MPVTSPATGLRRVRAPCCCQVAAHGGARTPPESRAAYCDQPARLSARRGCGSPRPVAKEKKERKLGRGKQGSDDLCLPVAPPMSNGRPVQRLRFGIGTGARRWTPAPVAEGGRQLFCHVLLAWVSEHGTLLPSMSVAAAQKSTVWRVIPPESLTVSRASTVLPLRFVLAERGPKQLQQHGRGVASRTARTRSPSSGE